MISYQINCISLNIVTYILWINEIASFSKIKKIFGDALNLKRLYDATNIKIKLEQKLRQVKTDTYIFVTVTEWFNESDRISDLYERS